MNDESNEDVTVTKNQSSANLSKSENSENEDEEIEVENQVKVYNICTWIWNNREKKKHMNIIQNEEDWNYLAIVQVKVKMRKK